MSSLPLPAAEGHTEAGLGRKRSKAVLRGKPGRPRKNESGHISAISHVEPCVKEGPDGRALDNRTIAPRLLDLQSTAEYLAVSTWTVRDLEAAGVLRRVCVPLPGSRELRKLLFDRADLDRLIETWKELAQ